jgi:PAS domain S-box-containing protein
MDRAGLIGTSETWEQPQLAQAPPLRAAESHRGYNFWCMTSAEWREAGKTLDTDFLASGGEMGELIRRHDWSATPLGPLFDWPQPLRAAVTLCVRSQFPTIIHWGWPDLVVLYNDAFIPLVGDKHPTALGARLFDSWPELRLTIENMLERVFTTGQAALSKDLLHVYRRSGYFEERYLTASFNPIVLDSGEVGGSFTLADDTTDRVIGERRLRTLRDLAARSMEAKEIDEACRIAAEAISENRFDLPFALFYLPDEDRRRARLVANVGLNPGQPASPTKIELTQVTASGFWPIARAFETNSVQQVDNLEGKSGPLPGDPWNDSPRCGLVVPITLVGQHVPTALLVAGISPRKQIDAGYREFLDSISKLLAATFMRVQAYRSLAIREVVDLIPVMIGVLNAKGDTVYSNQAVRVYTGLTNAEVTMPDLGSRIFHPEDSARLDDERHKGLLAVVPFKQERRFRRKDGQYRWFLVQYNPQLDDQGRVVRWYVTATDIDDRVRAEETTRNENLILREQIERDSMYEDIVGSSAPLRRVLSQVSKVAPSDSTVLILGETGTGKELVARAIHKRSRRSSRAFIAVNCAAIPPSLIASELFGHERGAFTGATQRRLGRFETANGGTIFLDEIGDLPQDIQIALLRVLQQREIERVGSDRPLPIDVRVVAATHRDLDALVSEGKFRQDLYYRLNVVPIQMPSLRERAADIPLLVEYFIARFGKKAGKQFRALDKNSLKLLQEYAWPGNIRELQNVIERAVILSESDTLAVDDTWLKRERSEVPRPATPLSSPLLQQERVRIEKALANSRGRVSGREGAAAKLGIPTRTLDSKIKRLGIDKYRFKSQAQ